MLTVKAQVEVEGPAGCERSAQVDRRDVVESRDVESIGDVEDRSAPFPVTERLMPNSTAPIERVAVVKAQVSGPGGSPDRLH